MISDLDCFVVEQYHIVLVACVDRILLVTHRLRLAPLVHRALLLDGTGVPEPSD